MDNYLYLFHYLSSQYEKPLSHWTPLVPSRWKTWTWAGGRTLERIDINSQDHSCSILPRVRAEEVDFLLLFDQLYTLGAW
jgi:hypothetical protein